MPSSTPRQDGSVAEHTKSTFDIHARQALIVGMPPRIPPLKPNEFGKEASETVTELRKAVSLPPTDNVPEYVAIVLRYPALYRRHTELALQLFGGALSPRHRELAVLCVGWLCQAPYEWGEHVDIGKRVAKLTSEEIDRVTRGSAAPGWNEDDRAIIRAVEELHQDAMISDETWAALARSLNEQQLIELPILVGQYQGVAYFLNSVRCRLMPGNPGLSAR
ncbi:MAG: carboxymuconolactone decarboxylase family protein [Rhizomicrobium sp.]